MDPPKFHPQGVRLDRAARGAPYVPLSERLAKPALLPAPIGAAREEVGATASLRADKGERKQRVAAMVPPSGEKALGSHLRADAKAQAARHIVFAAAFPHIELAGRTHSAITGIQTQLDFPKRNHIVPALVGGLDLKN